MYIQFLRDRITQLRLQKGVSEYQMSLDLGHSRGYIQNISSGKSLPSVEGLFESVDDPALVAEAVKGLRQLSDSDKLLILNHINRLTHG